MTSTLYSRPFPHCTAGAQDGKAFEKLGFNQKPSFQSIKISCLHTRSVAGIP